MGGDAEILWRRLDVPGHDACRLVRHEAGWALSGTAVWLDGAAPAVMAYEVTAGEDWVTHSARLRGRTAATERSFSILRDSAGNWRMNGEPVPEVTGHRDLDLGFTPATNLLPIRRLRAEGRTAADLAAAWLDPAGWALKPLPQHYRRGDRDGDGDGCGEGVWDYASGALRLRLSVDEDGFVTDYPGLWVQEGGDGRA